MPLSEPLGALSIAADFATGRPVGSSLGTTVVNAKLAQIMGLSVEDQKNTYYTTTARFLGCTATGPEASAMTAGDDHGFCLAFQLCDWFDRESLRKALEDNVALHVDAEKRQEIYDAILSIIDDFPTVTKFHCAQARLLAKRLRLPSAVVDLVPYYYARWDGKWKPYEGEDIPVISRLFSIGETAELYRRLKNAEEACEEIRRRSGKQLDPNICSLFLAHSDEIFAEIEGKSDFDTYVAAEPGAPIAIAPAICSALAEVAADVVDQKSVWFSGHSKRVSAFAAEAAKRAGLDPEQSERVRQAGLVHDIGKTAVSNRIWDKQEQLSTAESLEMQSHSYQTEFILSHAEPFRSLCNVAASAYERADGSGYHKRIRLTDLAANLLAAADMYDMLTHDQPNRPALSFEDAAAALEREARDGKLSPLAVSSVLQSAGHGVRQSEQALPSGLTRREAQVLSRLARWETTAKIAQALKISEKTADHHIQSIYSKTGIRGRAPIAIFALEHGIVMD